MIPVAESTPHTDAVEAALVAADVLVGRAVAPASAGWQGEPGRSTYVPYCVIFPMLGVPDGNVAEPLEYLDYSAQISCWGATEGQASTVADQVRAALIGKRLTVTGRSTYPVRQPSGGPPIVRQDSPPPAEYHAVVEIAFRSQAL